MNENPALRKLVLLGATPLAVVVIAAASVGLADQVPVDAIPSHWGRGGLSDDTMPLGAFTSLMFVLAGLLGLGAISLRHRMGDTVSQRVLGGAAVGVPLAVAALHVGTLLAARGTTGPIPFPDAAGGVALALLVGGGVLGAALVRPIERQGRQLDAVPIDVQPGEAVVWTGTTTAPAWLWSVLVVAALVSGAAFLSVELPWLGAALTVLLLSTATLLRVRVSVGPAGVTARLGPFGLVRFHVPLDQVASSSAEQVQPLAYGGWGIRILPGVRAIVLRSGPGLRVERRDGSALVVTVAEAGVAAGVLEAHLAQRRR